MWGVGFWVYIISPSCITLLSITIRTRSRRSPFGNNFPVDPCVLWIFPAFLYWGLEVSVRIIHDIAKLPRAQCWSAFFLLNILVAEVAAVHQATRFGANVSPEVEGRARGGGGGALVLRRAGRGGAVLHENAFGLEGMANKARGEKDHKEDVAMLIKASGEEDAIGNKSLVQLTLAAGSLGEVGVGSRGLFMLKDNINIKGHHIGMNVS